MKPVKKASRFSHTSNQKKGMGDYYGTGVRNPVGKPIDVFGVETQKSKKMGKPPKSLA